MKRCHSLTKYLFGVVGVAIIAYVMPIVIDNVNHEVTIFSGLISQKSD